MNKADLERMADRYQAKADKAYQNYQETGTPRYEREYHNYDDLAAALRVAAGSKDAHDQLISIRCDLAILAAKAQNLLGSNSTGSTAEAKARDILADLVATASVYNLIRKE